MALLREKPVELDAVIEAHKKKHHRDGCCYCGSNGCCDVESIMKTSGCRGRENPAALPLG